MATQFEEYVTIYTETGPKQIPKSELTKYEQTPTGRYVEKKEQKKEEPVTLEVTKEQAKELQAPKEGTVQWLPSGQYMQYEKGQWALYEPTGKPAETAREVKIVQKVEQPQVKTDLQNLVKEKQQIQGRIGYDIPRIVQPAELEKILASGATLYRVPVPKDLSKYTITQLQQREDFLGFGTYDKEAVMWFTKQPSQEELNKIFEDNRRAFASEVVSKWSPTEVAATKAALLASPEGFGFFGSIVAKYAGLKTGMSPEEYMLNKVREAQAEIKAGREAQYIAKGALFSLGSPIGLPVVAYAAGVMTEPIASGIYSAIRNSNIATRIIGTGTLLGTSAALTGIPIASSIKAIKEGQADVGIGGLTAITEIGIGAKIGATHMAEWEAQQKQLAIQKELETQLKETKFFEKQMGNEFKGVAKVESAENIKVVNVPDLAKGETRTMIGFEKPEYSIRGVVKSAGVIEDQYAKGAYQSAFNVYEKGQPIATELRMEPFLSKSAKVASIQETSFYYARTTPAIQSTGWDWWEKHSFMGVTKLLAIETQSGTAEFYSVYGVGRYRNEITGSIEKFIPGETSSYTSYGHATLTQTAQLPDIDKTVETVQNIVVDKAVKSAIDTAAKSVSSNVPSAGMSSAITTGAIAPAATKTEVKTESLTSVETAQVSGQQLNTREIVTTIQKVETSSKSKEKIGTVTVEGMKNIEQERESFGQIQVPIQVQIQSQEQKQMQAVATVSSPAPVTTPTPTVVKTPKVEIPFFSIGLPSFSGRKIAIATTSKVFKDIQKYKPSLYSLMKGLKIKMPTEITKAVYRPKIGKVKIL